MEGGEGRWGVGMQCEGRDLYIGHLILRSLAPS